MRLIGETSKSLGFNPSGRLGKDHLYKAQEEVILTVGVIVGNPFLTNEGSFVQSPRGGYLISGVFWFKV